MPEPAICVDKISKRYLVEHRGDQREKYSALRDVIAHGSQNIARSVATMFRKRQRSGANSLEEFWALRDISFDVQRGEVVGIIGRNGAGKSTLLKILSRITEPTKGRVTLRGRACSLLEIGTGFHNELTGRENIFLSGAVLGMSRLQIRKKFDEIVAFAGVERFVDTPVKRFSSGMYVRLAFAVAAHLEPDILIVDEVLAVGDADFQRKCLDRMGDASRLEGRTVLFVSHDMAAVGALTQRSVLLESGRISAIGATADIISTYVSKNRLSTAYVRPQGKPIGSPHISRVEVLTSDLNGVHRVGEPLTVKFWIRHQTPLSKGCLSFQIVNSMEHPAVRACAFYPQIKFGEREGETLLTCYFQSLRLNIDQFHLRAVLSEPPGQGVYEDVNGLCFFEVVPSNELKPWGWHRGDCVYHEDWTWSALASHPESNSNQTRARSLSSWHVNDVDESRSLSGAS